MDRSAIILAFGASKGFSEDKGALFIDGRALINRVVDAVNDLTDEIIVVTTNQKQVDNYKKILSPEIRYVVCDDALGRSLPMAICGLEVAKSEYSLLLPFDSPFVSKDVVALLLDLSSNKCAVIPRSPNNEAEPLHAVYNTRQVLEAAKKVVDDGQFEIDNLPERLQCVRYISTMVIEQLDPDLKTFFRIITPLDLRKASVLSKPRKTKK